MHLQGVFRRVQYARNVQFFKSHAFNRSVVEDPDSEGSDADYTGVSVCGANRVEGWGLGFKSTPASFM